MFIANKESHSSRPHRPFAAFVGGKTFYIDMKRRPFSGRFRGEAAGCDAGRSVNARGGTRVLPKGLPVFDRFNLGLDRISKQSQDLGELFSFVKTVLTFACA